MKKGLILTLMVAAIAFVGVKQGYAFAPEIGNIPNIIVGDAEDNVGTVDNNFFRFSSAINLADASTVSDADTSNILLLWSFMEADTSTSLTINGKNQLAGAEDPNAPPVGKELTSAGTEFWATFRLTALSNPLDEPAPFPNPGETSGTVFFNRIITLFASDGTNNDSKDIIVYAIENGFDGTSASQATQVLSHNFDATTEGASALVFDAPTAVPNPFSGATTSYSGGRLGLGAPNNTSNYFGSWNSTAGEIPYTANKLYRARWEVTTDQATAANLTSARFRIYPQAVNVNTGSFQFNAGGTNTNVPPVSPTTRTYNQYYQPAADFTSLQSNSLTSGLSWSFDIIDFGASVSGSLFLDSMIVETMDRPTLGTADATITTINASEWFIASGTGINPTFQSVTSAGVGTGTFSWTVAAGSTSAVGVMQNIGATSPPSIPMTADDLYRAVFSLTIGNSADKDNAPRIRLRLQDSTETAAEYDIQSAQLGIATPNTTTTTYDVYLVGPSNSGTPLGASLGFDAIAFDTLQSGTISLEQIDVESGSQP